MDGGEHQGLSAGATDSEEHLGFSISDGTDECDPSSDRIDNTLPLIHPYYPVPGQSLDHSYQNDFPLQIDSLQTNTFVNGGFLNEDDSGDDEIIASHAVQNTARAPLPTDAAIGFGLPHAPSFFDSNYVSEQGIGLTEQLPMIYNPDPGYPDDAAWTTGLPQQHIATGSMTSASAVTPAEASSSGMPSAQELSEEQSGSAETAPPAQHEIPTNRINCTCVCGCTKRYGIRKKIANIQCAECRKRTAKGQGCLEPAPTDLQPSFPSMLAIASAQTSAPQAPPAQTPTATTSIQPNLPFQDIFDEATADNYHNHKGGHVMFSKLEVKGTDDVSSVSEPQALRYRERIFDGILHVSTKPRPDGVDPPLYDRSQREALVLCQKHFARADQGKHASACATKLYFIVVNLHKNGIPESEIDEKNVNKTISGHIIDRQSKFSVRMEKVIAIVEENKRVADDLAKFTGLFDLACAPDSYVDTKNNNLKNNTGRANQVGQIQEPQGGHRGSADGRCRGCARDDSSCIRPRAG